MLIFRLPTKLQKIAGFLLPIKGRIIIPLAIFLISCFTLDATPHISQSRIEYLKPQTEQILIQATRQIEQVGKVRFILLPKNSSKKAKNDVLIVGEIIRGYIVLRDWEITIKKGAVEGSLVIYIKNPKVIIC